MNTGNQRTQRAITLKIQKIYEMKDQGFGREEICERLKISKYQYYHYLKKDSSKEVEKQINPDRYLGKIKPLKEINRNLNPVEFCKEYLPINPTPMQELILKAFYNLEMNEEEKMRLLKLKKEGKTTWEEGADYQELVLLIGMKGTKTTLASMISQIEEYELFKAGDISKKWGFIPGEEVYIINVATNRKQAAETIFAKTRACIERSPYFKARNPECTENTYHFRDTNVFIMSGHSNSSSLVGKTCKEVGFDELDRFQNNTTGKYSAEEVYEGLVRSTDPFGRDRRIVSLSSLVHGKGFMVHLYELSKSATTMLGFWMAEWEMNPHQYSGKTFFYKIPIPVEHRDSFAKNPEKFLRDKACMFGYTRGAYYREPDKIKAIFEQSHNEGYKNPVDSQGRFADWFKTKEGCRYYEHHDPSVSHDAYAIGLGHEDKELEITILDLIIRFTPPPGGGEIDIEKVKEFCDALHGRVRPEKITYDTWAASAIMQEFEKQGIQTENLYIRKPQHDLLKEKIYSGKFRSHKYTPLEKELPELELDGDKVNHPASGSKDTGDAAAGVVWDCREDSGVSAGVAIGGADAGKEISRAGFKELEYAGRKRIWD